MRKFVFILVFMLLAALGLAWSSFETPSAGLPADGRGRGALVVAVSEDCGSLDPGFTSTLTDFRIIRSLYEPLLRTPYGGGPPEPGAAAALPDITPDGLTYHLAIRPEAKWSNGDPVLAQDFRYAWMRAMLPDTGSQYVSLMELIAGAKDFGAWRLNACALAEAMNGDGLDAVLAEKAAAAKTATDKDAAKKEAQMLRDFLAQNPWLNDPRERTAEKTWARTLQAFDRMVGIKAQGRSLEITLEKPAPYFTALLAFPTFSPLHQKSMEARRTFMDGTVRLNRDARYFLPDTLVSNGPYRLAEWHFRRRMVLDQNAYYWQKDAMNNLRLVQRVVPEAALALRLYNEGEIDILVEMGDPILQAQLVAAAKTGKHPDVHNITVAGTYYYQFNCRPEVNGRKNPLADPRVRRALAGCIDRRTLIDEVTRLGQPEALTLTPPGAITGYAPPVETGVPFDLNAAKALLKEAGYADGTEVGPIGLLYNNNGSHKDVALVLAKNWETSLGLTIKTDACEFHPMLDRRRAGNFDICRGGWYGDYADPTTFLDMFVTGNSNNDGAYSNPEYDALMAQATNERDAAKRFAILRQAETILLQDAPLATIYHNTDLKLFDAAKHDLKPDAWANYRFERVVGNRR